MALVAAKCTECGAAIEVEETKDAGICSFCGTAFVTQKAINEHHTHVTKHITKNVFGVDGKSAEDFYANGETFLKLKEWEKAEEAFEQAKTIEPSNYLGWLGLARTATRDFSNINSNTYIEYLDKALAVANNDEKEIINKAFERHLILKKEFEKLVAGHQQKINKIEARWGLWGWLGPMLGTILGFGGVFAAIILLTVFSNIAVGLPLMIVGIVGIIVVVIFAKMYSGHYKKVQAILDDAMRIQDELLKRNI
ncbi:MAG: tetratricopeptide repeat protein [Firmicutes bacterium]|nr:tetratricopeptide repeat protein [Bacillota bacterium]